MKANWKEALWETQGGETFTDFKNVSLDEKAYTKGHKYASILIDSDKDYVMELIEGRKEKNVKALFFSINSQEHQAQLERVNIDMWKPYINVIKEIAPQAIIVHDNFTYSKNYQKRLTKQGKKKWKKMIYYKTTNTLY